ncbi:MAG: TRAP transporter permease [Deltaproteobacteria bacterium]|nr:TRAP transporter permease [Deltaproteobacteria bacterium]
MDIHKKAKGILDREDEKAGKRALSGSMATLFTIVAISMSIFHLYTAGYMVFTAMVQRSIHLCFALTLIFLLYPAVAKSPRRKVPLMDWAFILLSVISCLYITMNWEALSEAVRIAEPTGVDIALGIIATLLVLEATRRTAGMALPIVAIAFILYGFLGPYMPGILNHPGIPLNQFIGMNYLFTEGIFGVPLGVSASFVIVFIIFGGFLEESGGGKFFIDLACAFFGAVRGGPAKIAIFSSGFFGSISGSAVANVVATGTFTIPMMKRIGYRPHFAGAVEAVASTGGLLMPPVMGAAAFVMAEILGISYLSVCLAAAIPAILYYLSLFVFIDLEAAKTGLQGIPLEEKPRVKRVIREGGHLLIPPALLVYLLAIVQWSPMKAGFYTILATVAMAMMRKNTRLDGRKLLSALRKGATGALQVAAVCACAGIVISIVSITGLGLTFSSVLIQLAHGDLFLLLILTMIASLILGMGLPATPCYIILAVLAAPAIVDMKVPTLAAHLFVFYFGCISAITPPVAVAAYAGAAIAGADPMRTGYTAWRLGLAAFIVPFMFIYGPPLIMNGTITKIILASITSLIGVSFLAASIQGFTLTRLFPAERIFLFAAALLLIKTGWMTDLAGIVIGLIIAVFHVARYRKERQAGRSGAVAVPGSR